MKNTRLVAVGGVMLLGTSVTDPAIAKVVKEEIKIEPAESISSASFQHCDVHVENTIPGPEAKMDVNVPAITGGQTVDKPHSVDAWITQTANKTHSIDEWITQE